jgi:hypothetical protein
MKPTGFLRSVRSLSAFLVGAHTLLAERDVEIEQLKAQIEPDYAVGSHVAPLGLLSIPATSCQRTTEAH